MYPFLAMPPEITPAGALKFVRDHGPVTFAKIQEEFGIGHSTDSRTQLRRGKLDAVLRQLVEAELLRPCHDQPVRARLRESDEFEVTPLAGQIQNSRPAFSHLVARFR
jgi:hypothetical protein